jgi:hypothetical protein
MHMVGGGLVLLAVFMLIGRQFTGGSSVAGATAAMWFILLLWRKSKMCARKHSNAKCH